MKKKQVKKNIAEKKAASEAKPFVKAGGATKYPKTK